MVMSLLSVDDVLATATTIYEQQDEIGREALRSLIDTYYTKIQHEFAGRSLFTESQAICPQCTGVRLLKREGDITITTSTLSKDYKCPVCKSWYSASEVTSAIQVPVQDPIFIWRSSDAPEGLGTLCEDGWIILVPQKYIAEKLPFTGDTYGVLSDGRIGQIQEGVFKVREGIPPHPDLFGYRIITEQII